jgi:hypothetical protein
MAGRASLLVWYVSFASFGRVPMHRNASVVTLLERVARALWIVISPVLLQFRMHFLQLAEDQLEGLRNGQD